MTLVVSLLELLQQQQGLGGITGLQALPLHRTRVHPGLLALSLLGVDPSQRGSAWPGMD